MNLKRWTKLGAAAGIAGAAAAIFIRNSKRPDVDLEREVSGALVGEFGDSAAGIEVRSQGKRIALRGEVATLEEIGAYEQAARSVPGVGDVDNLLRLAARSVKQK